MAAINNNKFKKLKAAYEKIEISWGKIDQRVARKELGLGLGDLTEIESVIQDLDFLLKDIKKVATEIKAVTLEAIKLSQKKEEWENRYNNLLDFEYEAEKIRSELRSLVV
jgi:hypothetical protein